MDYPFLPKSRIQRAARLLREETFGDEAVYRVDLDAVAYDVLYPRDDLVLVDDEVLPREDGEKVLGITQPIRGRIKICASLREDRYPGRRRFTIAHEIGHWILHRELFQPLANQDGMLDEQHDRIVTLQRNIESAPTSQPEEWQANHFAAWLLIGEIELREEVRKRYDQYPVMPPKGMTLKDFANQMAADRSDGTSLADRFGVSRTAMRIALENRGLVTHSLPLFS